MLTVWSVCTGDKYPVRYVYALRDMVAANLPAPYKFRCITEHEIPGISTLMPYMNWPGWWSKLNLFNDAVGPSLYFDLDVVITGDLDYLVPYTQYQLAAPANWAQSGHGGIQSSVLAWNGEWREPFTQCQKDDPFGRLWGDQEYLWELLGDDWVRIPGVGSYKYHVHGAIPDWMRVCVFHGEPKPHQVTDECLQPYTSILLTTNSSTAGGGIGASSATA